MRGGQGRPGHSRSARVGRGVESLTLLPRRPRHLHQQPDGRLPPARRNHGPHLPRHGPPLAGSREGPGGLLGAYPPAPDGWPRALSTQHVRLLPVPSGAPLRTAAEPVSRSCGSGGRGAAGCPPPRPLTAPSRRLFAECHALIPPAPFVSSCVSDGCQADSPGAPCRSLEAYAALCRARGACSNWRNATSGLCGESGRPWALRRPRPT